MNTHPLQCRCGTLKGHVSHPERVARGTCYCKDCQAFAHFLGSSAETLDEAGGTDVIATRPGNVTFTQGTEALACMRLTNKGLLRWYASCCNTPIGNTPPDLRMSFVGLTHDCLDAAGQPLDASFGPTTMWVMTKSAKRKVDAHALSTIATMLRFMPGVLLARFTGGYKTTPFFDVAKGTPMTIPRVLTREEHQQLMGSL
ncbi:MAG TPA: DUF6151 family protein [Rhodocyclaceae bacterium]|nr:DUF6151 family protein [Rhodocyclaceae bacterium]